MKRKLLKGPLPCFLPEEEDGDDEDKAEKPQQEEKQKHTRVRCEGCGRMLPRSYPLRLCVQCRKAGVKENGQFNPNHRNHNHNNNSNGNHRRHVKKPAKKIVEMIINCPLDLEALVCSGRMRLYPVTDKAREHIQKKVGRYRRPRIILDGETIRIKWRKPVASPLPTASALFRKIAAANMVLLPAYPAVAKTTDGKTINYVLSTHGRRGA